MLIINSSLLQLFNDLQNKIIQNYTSILTITTNTTNTTGNNRSSIGGEKNIHTTQISTDHHHHHHPETKVQNYSKPKGIRTIYFTNESQLNQINKLFYLTNIQLSLIIICIIIGNLKQLSALPTTMMLNFTINLNKSHNLIIEQSNHFLNFNKTQLNFRKSANLNYLDYLTLSQTKTNFYQIINKSGNLSVTNVYMRSKRKKRSLEFYMSNCNVCPLYFSIYNNHTRTTHYLNIADNGTISITTSDKNPSALMTISVIVERSNVSTNDLLWQALQPRDGSRVILRRFGTNICICMSLNGTVVTERFINRTVTDNCEWLLRVSRYGLGFESLINEDDDNNNNFEMGRNRSKSHLNLKNYSTNSRLPTLSVTKNYFSSIASGWENKLWQPEATWLLYGLNFGDHLLFTNQMQNRSTNFDNYNNLSEQQQDKYFTHKQNNKNTDNNNNSSSSSSSSSSSDTKLMNSLNLSAHTSHKFRRGDEDVIVLEAPADRIEKLQQNAQKSYCDQIRNILYQTVQKELLFSIKIFDELRNTYRKLINLLEINPPMNSLKNNLNETIADLFNQWIILIDHKWRYKIRKLYTNNNQLNIKLKHIPCKLSLKSIFEQKHFINNDPYLIELYEKQVFTKIYYNLFNNIKHLVKWSFDEKRKWLKNPRMTKIFRLLNLNKLDAKKFRQASFILHQYLPQFSPDNSNYTNINYGVNGKFDLKQLKKIFKNPKIILYSINRAISLKFEQLHFWPKPYNSITHKYMQHSPIDIENLNLNENDICFKSFLKHWKLYQQDDSFNVCTKLNKINYLR